MASANNTSKAPPKSAQDAQIRKSTYILFAVGCRKTFPNRSPSQFATVGNGGKVYVLGTAFVI